MGTINMDAIKVQVKDVANFLNNLGDLDYRVIAAFYDEDGFYIGRINRNGKDGYLFIDNELRGVWRNKVKFYNKLTVQGVDILAFIGLKGEER